MKKNTKLVYLIGTQGVGKTSNARALCQELEIKGFRVYYLPEMSFPINSSVYPYGTMEFQNRYMRELIDRHSIIECLYQKKNYDFIIIDRCLMDVGVYSYRVKQNLNISKYHDVKLPFLKPNPSIFTFLLTYEKIEMIVKRLNKRDDDFREEWNETDTQYIKDIDNYFRKVMKETYTTQILKHLYKDLQEENGTSMNNYELDGLHAGTRKMIQQKEGDGLKDVTNKILNEILN